MSIKDQDERVKARVASYPEWLANAPGLGKSMDMSEESEPDFCERCGMDLIDTDIPYEQTGTVHGKNICMVMFEHKTKDLCILALTRYIRRLQKKIADFNLE